VSPESGVPGTAVDAPDDEVTAEQVRRDEVDREQAHLDGLYARLDTVRERARQALADLRASAVSPTPAGRAERDAFDALHTERLRQLQSVEDRLCFGRLDLVAGSRQYIGRIGLSDDDQAQLLIDWRAPAAATFYQATAAAPAGVARRRHLSTRGRTVTDIDDELLDAAGLDAAALGTVTGDGALMTALTAHRTGHMRDIVATLQAEQDQVVRAPMSGVLVVQGGPGTGKTAVALHRAAYLLYTHRERIAKSGVLVVGPSTVFLRYIDRVLPSLGETGVVLSTPGQLFPGIDATGREAPEAAAVKGGLRMAQLVRNAVRQRQRLIERTIPLVVDGDRIGMRPGTVANARNRARQTGRPHNEARVTFVRHVLDDLGGQLARARNQEFEGDTRLELLAELRDDVHVRREINLRWMPLTPAGVLERLYGSPAALERAAAGLLKPREAALLRRDPGSAWTPADVPLLDEAAELIGADVAASADQARSAARASRDRAETLEYARQVLENTGDAGAMVSAEALADRFAEGGALVSVADRARDDRTWTYGHLVVDEAQEASPMLWRMLARRVPSRSMTVVGDLAQTGSAAGADSWAEALDPIAQDRWHVRELTVNYRTPARIMRPATRMLQAAGVGGFTPAESAREGEWDPEDVRVDSPAGLAAAVLAALARDDALLGGGRLAVVRPRAAGALADEITRAATGFDDRLNVLTVDDAKGLEFDSVIVVEPAQILAESPRGANDLYVALTRPTQRLTLVRTGELPAGLEAPIPG
jgi:DNA helicase IV